MVQDPIKNAELIKECKKLIAVNKTKIFFVTPITVKSSPHNLIMIIYGCEMDIDEHLKVMDIQEKWHELLPDQNNVSYILYSLLQRLKSITSVSVKD